MAIRLTEKAFQIAGQNAKQLARSYGESIAQAFVKADKQGVVLVQESVHFNQQKLVQLSLAQEKTLEAQHTRNIHSEDKYWFKVAPLTATEIAINDYLIGKHSEKPNVVLLTATRYLLLNS